MITLNFERFSENLYRIKETRIVGIYWLLYFWIKEVLNSYTCIREIALLKEKAPLACSYELVSLSKEDDYIVIEDMFDHDGTGDKFYIPKDKFAQILAVIKNEVHPAVEEYNPKEFSFVFDDNWNCSVSWKNS